MADEITAVCPSRRIRLCIRDSKLATLCKCETRESQSVRGVCDLEAYVVQRGGSNQKNQSKMAVSRESVTGKYFM